MTMTIYREKRHPDRVFLIDTKSISFLPEPGNLRSEKRPFYEAAVEIGNLTPDKIEIETDGGEIKPRPCAVMVMGDDCYLELSLASQGIETEAAKVMLNLALAFNNLKKEASRGRFRFQEPAEKGTYQNWSEWLFIAAWLWSAWKGVPHRIRHSQMLCLGYTEDERAFRTMLSRAGLKEKNRDEDRRGKSCYQ